MLYTLCMQKEEKIKIMVFVCVLVVSVLGYTFFPARDLFQTILSQIVFFVLFPFLVLKFSLGENLKSRGLLFFSHLNGKDLFRIAGIFLFAFGLFLTLFSFTPLHQYYFPPKILSQSFLFFFLYSVLVEGIFSLVFTFFFQGFVLFSLESFFKKWAIFLQWLFLLFVLSVSGKLDWSMTLQVYTTLFSGYVAASTRSVPVAFLFSWILILFLEMTLLRFF